jgi:hypothetical protein
MTLQSSQSRTASEAVQLDKPMFDAKAFRLSGEQAGIIARAR